MKILSRLNLYNLRQNRARTAMTIIGIALSVVLILTTIGVASSFMHTLRVYAIKAYGDYHILYRNIPGDVVSVLENTKYYEV